MTLLKTLSIQVRLTSPHRTLPLFLTIDPDEIVLVFLQYHYLLHSDTSQQKVNILYRFYDTSGGLDNPGWTGLPLPNYVANITARDNAGNPSRTKKYVF